MDGKILDYDFDRHIGVIAGIDGARYSFTGGEFKSRTGPPRPGMPVDFAPIDGEVALAVYPDVSRAGSGGVKTKTNATLLAFFFGVFGAHKFYLGKTTAGVITIVAFIYGWLLLFPPFIIWVIVIIEFIIYLVKSEEDFQDDYVNGDKAWF